MKVLITNTGPWGTGSFTVAFAVLRELQQLGHEVAFFFPDSGVDSKLLEQYYAKPEFHIWKFPLKNKKAELSCFPLMIPDPHPRSSDHTTFRDLSEEQLTLYFSSAKEHLEKIIREFQPDIIECQHIWALDHIIDEMDIPYICTAHHSDQMGFRFDKRIQPFALHSASKASYIFAISEFVKKDVVSLYGVEEEKVIVLTNGYNKTTFHPIKINRERVLQELNLNIPSNAVLVSFAGKISRTKGVDTLMEANHYLGKNSNIHFLIFGAGDPKTMIPKNQPYLLDRLHFLGHRTTETIARVHNICDFSIMPSRSEGFGIACLEAMACGLPVVATKSGGLEEFAVGTLIDPANPEQLAAAICDMANLPEERQRVLSDQAIEVANSYSWKAITEQRINYYEKTLERINS